MSLCRDYTCTRCGTPVHGIPFGPVGAAWCLECFSRSVEREARVKQLEREVDAASGDPDVSFAEFMEVVNRYEAAREAA